MHIRKKSRGLTCYFLFFSFFSPSPSHLPSPCPSFPFTQFVKLPALVENYLRIYTPDSLLSCIIRLIPKFLSSFALVPLSIFFISFPLIFFPSFISKFVLLFSFLFPPFPLFFPFSFPFPFPSISLPFFFTLLWFSSLALRAFDSFPPLGGGNYRRIYTPD